MEDDSPGPWSDEVLEPKLKAAVERHLPALAAGLSPSETAELEPLCHRAFSYTLNCSRADDPEEVFREEIPKAVHRAVSLGAEAIRQSLADSKVIGELGVIAGWISRIARKLLHDKISLTPELRETVYQKKQSLNQLLETVNARHRHLTDRALPQPALVISNQRMMSMRIGDCINNFRYVLEYPNGHVLSLELAHEARAKSHKPDSKPSE